MGRFRWSFALVLSVLVVVVGLGVAPAASADTTTDKVSSRVVLLSDHSVPVKTWSPLPVRVRVEAADGTPLAGRNVRIWDDSYERWRCCGPPPWRTTDANGEVTATLHLDGNSAHPVRVVALWYGDDVYAKSYVEWYQPMVGYDTSLTVTHATQRSGQTLPVTVSVRRTDPTAPSTGCIDGAVVPVTLAGPTTLEATAIVDHDPFAGTCVGTVEFPSTLTPGRYTLTASTGHDGWSRNDEPQRYVGAVDVAWQFRYDDAAGRGSVYLSLASKDYRVVLADGRDSGIRHAGTGLTRTGVTGTVNVWRMNLAHTQDGDSANGEFYSTGSFSASGLLAGAGWDLHR